MNIGGFVSSSGGMYRAIERAESFGFTTLMLFIGTPQAFKIPDLSDEVVQKYKEALTTSHITATFAHALYLANLATPDNKLFHGSVHALTNTMIQGEKIGLDGVIFHLGSHKGTSSSEGLNRVIKGVKKILDGSPGHTKLLLENAVKQGDKVGVTFEELEYVLSAFPGEDRLGVCIDTCHTFASGYDFTNDEGFANVTKEIATHVGFEKIACFHLNDSQGECGSFIDRHANIGEGYIGRDGLKRILTFPPFSQKPFILEVPGIAGDGPSSRDREIVLSIL